MVVESVLEGIQVANKLYERWSMGWWTTDSGVEGHVVSEVAHRLCRYREDGQSLLMEMLFSYVGGTAPLLGDGFGVVHFDQVGGVAGERDLDDDEWAVAQCRHGG